MDIKIETQEEIKSTSIALAVTPSFKHRWIKAQERLRRLNSHAYLAHYLNLDEFLDKFEAALAKQEKKMGLNSHP